MKMMEPVVIAIIETRRIKPWISRAIGVGPASTPEVSEAIRPMTVLSPTLMIIPRATPWDFGNQTWMKLPRRDVYTQLGKCQKKPSTALDEKKARFLVSSGLLWVHSADRACGSDSPVNEELSTLKLLHERMRMSAGRRSPNFTSIRSPTTRSSTFIVTFFPSLVASANCKSFNS